MEASELLTSSFSSHSSYAYEVETSTVSEQRYARFATIVSGKIGDGWFVHKPLVVYLELDEDQKYLFSDEEFGVYGQGETLDQALNDYEMALSEYYEILEKHADADASSRAAFDSVQRYITHDITNETQPDRR